MQKMIIYTDGSCNVSTKIGGWAFFIKTSKYEKSRSGQVENTTNNRMELTAAIEALQSLHNPYKIYFYSDSNLIIEAFTKNKIEKWAAKDWKTNDKNDRRNKDLWLILLSLAEKHQIEWRKVKAHSSDDYNRKVDKLARKESRNKWGQTKVSDYNFIPLDKLNKKMIE